MYGKLLRQLREKADGKDFNNTINESVEHAILELDQADGRAVSNASKELTDNIKSLGYLGSLELLAMIGNLLNGNVHIEPGQENKFRQAKKGRPEAVKRFKNISDTRKEKA